MQILQGAAAAVVAVLVPSQGQPRLRSQRGAYHGRKSSTLIDRTRDASQHTASAVSAHCVS